MDVRPRQPIATGVLLLSILAFDPSATRAASPRVQFDMPAVTTAADTQPAAAARVVECHFALSTLIADVDRGTPIDHLLILCRLRDRSQVVDFAPKTELSSDYAGPISVTRKNEQTESFGFSLDASLPSCGSANLGGDDSETRSDSKQFQQQAPLQAVVASGTVDRGKGVYFKLRWTSTQVLEGEKHFQVSFAVPQAWRGGLVDVSVTAVGIDRPLFGSAKTKPLARQEFVVAVHQENDAEAASIALKLARLDRELTELAHQHANERSSGFAAFWKKVLDAPEEDAPQRPDWYYGVTSSRSDPYIDKKIRSLPMPIRVAVLGYADTARELMQLSDAG